MELDCQTVGDVEHDYFFTDVCRSELDSFNAWKVFVAAYPEEFGMGQLKRRRQIVPRPDQALPEYIERVTAPAFQWVTFLDLSHVTCTRKDLMSVSKLANIGALTFGRQLNVADGGLDDTIFRAWSRYAMETGAFSMLRVVACRRQKDLTHRTIEYITELPSLAMFIMEDCSIGCKQKPIAADLGWKYKTGLDLSNFLTRSGANGPDWTTFIHACFSQAGPYGVERLTEAGVEAINSLPILDFSLGRLSEDTKIDKMGQQSMRCFYRAKPSKRALQELTVSKKRPLGKTNAAQPGAKRLIKASKQQDFGSFMTQFGMHP